MSVRNETFLRDDGNLLPEMNNVLPYWFDFEGCPLQETWSYEAGPE
jgi:hypothetical protein